MKSRWLLERRLRMLIGTGQFERTEKFIRFIATKVDEAQVIAALDRPADEVRIEGWDTIGARMEDAKRHLNSDNEHREWHALILGLRNDTGVNGLHVETVFSLADEARPPSPLTDSLSDLQVREQDRMLATQALIPDTDFVSLDLAPLRLSGLEDLYDLEVDESGPWNERRPCSQDLAAAAILLRFHQCVERQAMTDGLPSELPVYATARPVSRPMESNDINFGVVASRRLTPRKGDYAARTSELVAEAERAREAEYIHETRRLVSQLRDADAVLARWPIWHNPFKRHNFAEQARIEQKLARDALRRMHGIDAVGAGGEALIGLLIKGRHGRITPDLLESLPADDRSELHQIRMVYAKRFGGRRVRAYLFAHPDHPARGYLDGS